ncbi:MAG TPA: glycosyltransferase family 39 protein [Alphaproteobacteria bacterium]|nr:glycosyltransferase family 39 protein [Alphaproteobacteria bacterium]
MKTALMVAMGGLHLAALAGLVVLYARRMKLPRRETPLLAFLLLWGALIAAGYIASLFDALGSLPAYAAASFLGIALLLVLHHAVHAPARRTPYAKPDLPEFVAISSPRLRKYLWIFLGATLAAAFLVHIAIALSFYPCNGDSMIYRLPRPFWYVTNGSLLHPFKSFDKRMTFYPLNGIMLYLPLVLYRLPGRFHYLPSLFCWLAIVYAAYRFARALGAERLTAFFATWLVALTPNILVQATSTNDEILAAAALLAALYFAWRWLVSGEEHYLFTAALGVGISAGTKPHVLYLIPLTLFAILWFARFLWRRREPLGKWLPSTRPGVWIAAFGILLPVALLFTVVNYISSGNIFYFGEYDPKVFNLHFYVQLIGQNLLVYIEQMILAPIATLDVFLSPHARILFEGGLDNFFAPIIMPFVSANPHFYHMHYRVQGVVIPTTSFLVEFSLWPGFAYLLWPLQWAGLARKKFTLRPLFILLSATPIVWLVTWCCVMLYMEGVPTYLAFFMIVAAPAVVFVFARAPSVRFDRLRWAVIGFVMATSLVINANVFVNSVFRGFRELASSPTYPDDWLRFKKPAIEEIRRASDIQVLALHTLTYYFAFMHWNPYARYYSPYQTPNLPPDRMAALLQITSVASEFKFGFVPLWIPDKPTAGVTYLGEIRGADEEAVFARGNGIEKRWPGRSDFILFTLRDSPAGGHYVIGTQKDVMGAAPADELQYAYEIKAPDGTVVYRRPWSADPAFSAPVPDDPKRYRYLLNIAVRSQADNRARASVSYPIEAPDAWRITGFGPGGYESAAPCRWNPLKSPGLVSTKWP